ncbi:hypothetical protein D3C84_1096960 [compost metagenome]
MLLIVGRYRLITRPGFVIRRLTGVFQYEGVYLSGCQATGLEVKPLKMIAAAVGANRQACMAGVTGIGDQDVTGIEVAINVQGG